MSRKANIFSFARTIADKRADIVRTRETINALAAQSDAFAPAYAVANTIAKFCESRGFGKYVYANPTSWGVGFNSLHVSIDDTVDSLSTGTIPAIIEFILEMGLNAKKSRDYADSGCASRSYNFETKIGGCRHRFSWRNLYHQWRSRTTQTQQHRSGLGGRILTRVFSGSLQP